MIARARATERAQLAALAGTTLQMETRGTLRDGKTMHTIEAMRHLAIAPDGSIHNDFVWGKIDGQPMDESGMRAASGAPKKRVGQAESLTVAMAPLTGSGVDVKPVGPRPGGYLLRCDVRRDAAVARIDLLVDEATGKKLSAALHPAGALVKLADRAEMELPTPTTARPPRCAPPSPRASCGSTAPRRWSPRASSRRAFRVTRLPVTKATLLGGTAGCSAASRS